MKRILAEEFHAMLRAQDVDPHREDFAFRCACCGQVQSMRSFMVLAGYSLEEAEKKIAFSCIGRPLRSGPAARLPGLDEHGARRIAPQPGKVGCDWSLGGLLRIHSLEVETPDGVVHPTFEPATREEAHALRASLAASTGASA